MSTFSITIFVFIYVLISFKNAWELSLLFINIFFNNVSIVGNLSLGGMFELYRYACFECPLYSRLMTLYRMYEAKLWRSADIYDILVKSLILLNDFFLLHLFWFWNNGILPLFMNNVVEIFISNGDGASSALSFLNNIIFQLRSFFLFFLVWKRHVFVVFLSAGMLNS